MWIGRGQLSPDKPGWIKASILIDTGAGIGLVKRDWCEKNGLQLYNGIGKRIRGFNGSETRVDQYIKLYLYDGDHGNLIGYNIFAVMPYGLMDHLCEDIIVGFDFITKYKLDLTFHTQEIILKSPQAEYKLPRVLTRKPNSNRQGPPPLNNSGPNIVPNENQQANPNQVGGPGREELSNDLREQLDDLLRETDQNPK